VTCGTKPIDGVSIDDQTVRNSKGWAALELRVHELAKELGVTAKEVLRACNDYGEFVKSASSTLPPRLVQKLREDLGSRSNRISARNYGNSAEARSRTDLGDGGFAASYEKPRRASRRPAHTNHKPGAIKEAIYRYAIDPGRARKGRYTPEEEDRAERLTMAWASRWLPDVIRWIEVSSGAHWDVAARLSEAGLSAADAALKLGFNRIDVTRDTIFDRIVNGTIGFNDAVRQVKEFRRTEQASGS
jgi:Translation initiation factor IF-2, N-terminal region